MMIAHMRRHTIHMAQAVPTEMDAPVQHCKLEVLDGIRLLDEKASYIGREQIVFIITIDAFTHCCSHCPSLTSPVIPYEDDWG